MKIEEFDARFLEYCKQRIAHLKMVPFVPEQEIDEPRCLARRALYRDHAVVGADVHRLGHRQRTQLRLLDARLGGVGAVGEKDVGTALCDEFAVGIAARRRWRRIRTAGELQGLGRKLLKRALAALLLDALEHQPGIVARRVGLRRRGAELDRRIEQAIDQRLGRHIDRRRDQGAHRVAREATNRASLAGRLQCSRMRHVGRGEHVGAFALRDAILQQARRAEREAHANAGLAAFERLRRLGQRTAQTAGGEHAQFGLGLRLHHRPRGSQRYGHRPRAHVGLAARRAAADVLHKRDPLSSICMTASVRKRAASRDMNSAP
ncbi:MAG: hypothetical protein LKCHEGNO_01157 [Burkholderiaceae bacterium]|nr:hypothetical protein [Burkholderiaceae bacterium]